MQRVFSEVFLGGNPKLSKHIVNVLGVEMLRKDPFPRLESQAVVKQYHLRKRNLELGMKNTVLFLLIASLPPSQQTDERVLLVFGFEKNRKQFFGKGLERESKRR